MEKRRMRRQFATGLLLQWCIAAMPQTDRCLDTVNVAAARKAETTAVQGLSRSVLKRRGATDLTDAVRRFSGVNIRDYGGAGGLKTLSVHSLGAGHTGVVTDGMMVADSESGQIDLSRFSLEQADSLALVVGDPANIFTPASLMSRAASLYIVKRVPQADMLTASLTGGSFGLLQACADGALLMRGGWSVRAQADFLRSDNQYPFTLTNVQQQTQEKRRNNALSRGRGELNLYHGHDFALKLYYYEAARQLPGQVIYYNPVNHERDRYRDALAQARWQHACGSRFSIMAAARASWSRERYSDRNIAWVKPDSTRVYDQTEASGSVCGLWTITRELDASLSADYSFQQLASQTLEVERPHRHTMLEALRLRWRSRSVTATAALLMSSLLNRVDRGTAAQDCHRLSPSASVAWTPCGWLTARLYYKDIFRPATFNDNYYTRSGSRDVKPEKARNLGLGIDIGRWGGTLSLEAYRAWVDDKIVAMPMNAFFWSIVNVGHVSIWGFEARVSGQWKPAAWLTVEPAASYTLQKAENRTDPAYSYYGHQIAYTPRHSAAASLSLLTPWLNIAASGNSMSERWSTNANLPASHIDGYTVLNIAAWRDLKFCGHECGLRAEVLNVADCQYDIIRLFPMPGRSFKATLTFNL